MRDYKNVTLSCNDIIKFLIVVFSLGLIVGYIFYDSFVIGIGFSLIFLSALPTYKKSLIEKNKKKLLEQFRDLLYSVSFSISCGRSMTQALEESKEFWQSTYDENDFISIEINDMLNQIHSANKNDVEVLKDFANRSGIDDIHDFVNTYQILKETGGNMPLAINRASSLIGDKIGIEKDIKTAFSQKKFESIIVAVSPFLLILMIKILSPGFISSLYESSSGIYISTLSLALMIFAIIMMWRIMKIEI